MAKMKNDQNIGGSGNVNINGEHNSVSIANNTTYNYHTPERKVTRTVVSGEYDKDMHLTQSQQLRLQGLVKEIVELDIILRRDKTVGECYSYIWYGVNSHCGATSYKLIKQENFEKAIKYLKQQKTIRRKDIKYKNAAKFTELTIPAIRARWSELGRGGDEIYDFASAKLKKSVSSLERLSVDDLDILYTRVFSLKKKL